MQLTENQREKIDHIMDNFDFNRVYDVMHFMKWTWLNSDLKEEYYPAVYELRKTARELLKRCCLDSLDSHDEPDENISYSLTTGGFTAQYCSGSEPDGHWENFDLKFCIEHRDTEEL